MTLERALERLIVLQEEINNEVDKTAIQVIIDYIKKIKG